MQTMLLSCLCGAACAVGVWAASSARATIDEMIRRGNRPLPPGEP